jgi:hypothetical protein
VAVYVDEMVDHGRRIGRAGPEWCHLLADSPEELHAAAEAVGLRRAWFQSSPGRLPHYDIGTAAKRAQAVRNGAVEVDAAWYQDGRFRDLLRRLRESWQVDPSARRL